MSTKTAPHLVAEIMANVAAYYANQVDHATFAARNRALWDEAEALSGLLEARRQSLETQEMEARLSELDWRANASYGFK